MTNLVEVFLQSLQFFGSFAETLLKQRQLVVQLSSLRVKRRLQLRHLIYLHTNNAMSHSAPTQVLPPGGSVHSHQTPPTHQQCNNAMSHSAPTQVLSPGESVHSHQAPPGRRTVLSAPVWSVAPRVTATMSVNRSSSPTHRAAT